MPEERRIRRLAPVLVFSLLCICLMALSACGARVEPKGQVATSIGVGK